MSPKKVREFFRPPRGGEPGTEGRTRIRTPFQLLVAVVLSAQATDKGVNRATRPLFRAHPTPQAMARWARKASPTTSRPSASIAPRRRTSPPCRSLLLERHGGEVPHDREALEALPGVGRKTANVVLNIAFGQPTIAVDTHIFRVGNRTGLAPGKDVEAVEQKLLKVVPAEFRLHAHHWLILHGRYVCKARKPDCPHCPVIDLCAFKEKTRV
jgi:endonuclease-3